MQQIHPENMIIIDIETASQFPDFESMDETMQELWNEKVSRIIPENVSVSEFYPMRAGVMAEFARIVCISVGYFNKEDILSMRIKSFYDLDEKKLLTDFISLLHKIESVNNKWCFAGHNIKEFDIPFICRRLIINRITIPAYLDFQNMKPWETNIIDTFQYWRFGDYKNYTSLKLLAAVMGIPSPKDDIDGSMVSDLYWTEDSEERMANIQRIVTYCQKDVLTTGNIILRFKNLYPVNASEVFFVK